MKARILWLVPGSVRVPRDQEQLGAVRPRSALAGIRGQPRRALRALWVRSALTGRLEMRWAAEEPGTCAADGSGEIAPGGDPGLGSRGSGAAGVRERVA
jgi:hypothetical protein